MNGTKPALASAGVWGAIATLALAGLAALGVAVDDDLAGQVETWLLIVGTAVSGGVSLWGRLKADKAISGLLAGPRYRRGKTAGRGRYLALLLPLTLLAGCAEIGNLAADPDEQLLDASAATYRAVAPAHADYLRGDADLAPADRARALRTLDAWRVGLDANGRDVPEVADDAELGLAP